MLNRPGTVVRNKMDKERKIGHRRVGEGGEITYKKIQTTQIMGSIQLGIQHTVRKFSVMQGNILLPLFWQQDDTRVGQYESEQKKAFEPIFVHLS
jgi:hypothetical protein